MGIKAKMILLALVITACVTAMAVTATVSVSNLSEEFNLLRSHEIITQLSVIKVSRDMNYLSRLSRDIMLGGNYERDMNSLSNIDEKVTNHFDVLEKAADNDEIKKLIDLAEMDAKDWLGVTRVMMTALGQISAEDRYKAYAEYERVVTPKAMKARDSFAKILQYAEKSLDCGVETFESTIMKSATTLIVISLIAIAIIIISFIVILRTILVEIEKRRHAEEALSASEKTARALLDGIDNSAYLIDPEGVILAINAKSGKTCRKRRR